MNAYKMKTVDKLNNTTMFLIVMLVQIPVVYITKILIEEPLTVIRLIYWFLMLLLDVGLLYLTYKMIKETLKFKRWKEYFGFLKMGKKLR